MRDSFLISSVICFHLSTHHLSFGSLYLEHRPPCSFRSKEKKTWRLASACLKRSLPRVPDHDCYFEVRYFVRWVAIVNIFSFSLLFICFSLGVQFVLLSDRQSEMSTKKLILKGMEERKVPARRHWIWRENKRLRNCAKQFFLFHNLLHKLQSDRMNRLL